MNVNDLSGNAIFGPTTELVAGQPFLRETLCNLQFEIGPTSFFQINPWQAERLYRRVEHLAGTPVTGAVAWDLYCGVGQISMILARSGYRTLGIEEIVGATLDAERNAHLNQLGDRLGFLAGRVEDLTEAVPTWAQRPSVVVVNPSRRGMDEGVRSFLAELLRRSPETRFIYVSCEMETLARDLKDLQASGFALRQIEGFDMFPHTDKTEWIAVLTQSPEKPWYAV